MSAESRRINDFFRNATRADVDSVKSRLLLSERQEKILDMFYIRKNGICYIADKLYVSAESVKRELRSIRDRFIPFI